MKEIEDLELKNTLQMLKRFFFNLEEEEEETGKNNFKILDIREEITEDVQFTLAHLKNKRPFKKNRGKKG